MPHRFEFLDGLRGVAALLIVTLHVVSPVGLARTLFPHAHLAVDFFFCLSGFVLSHAYAHRLGHGLTWRRFFLLRLIRLYPMLAVGTVLGALMIGSQLAIRQPDRLWSFLAASGMNLVLLPSTLYRAGELQEAWPANLPQWSLLFEFAASLAFPWLTRWRTGILVSIAVACAIPVLISAVRYQGVQGGITVDDWPLGFVRVAYPFIAGILLFRAWASERASRSTESTWRTLAGTGLLVVLLVAPIPDAFNGLYEGLCVVLFLPALLFVCASVSSSGWSLKAAIWLGALSYPLYAIHYPVVRALNGLLRRMPGLTQTEYLLGLALAVPLCIAIAWAALRWYDEPLRHWLVRRANGVGVAKSPAGAQLQPD